MTQLSEHQAKHRRARRIALGFGLPWGWTVHERSGRLIAQGNALSCGHRSVSTAVNGDILLASSRLAMMVTRHMRDGI